MTSLSKIYSRAKAVNKEKSTTVITTTTQSASITEKSSLLPQQVDKNKKSHSSAIDVNLPSKPPSMMQGGISGAIASFTSIIRKPTETPPAISNVVNGLQDIYFNNKYNGSDQYLTARPSRISSDPLKVKIIQQSEFPTIDKSKNKTWSNEVLTKALKPWPHSAVKPQGEGGGGGGASISSNSDNDEPLKLYDFSTPAVQISVDNVNNRKSIMFLSQNTPISLLEKDKEKERGKRPDVSNKSLVGSVISTPASSINSASAGSQITTPGNRCNILTSYLTLDRCFIYYICNHDY